MWIMSDHAGAVFIAVVVPGSACCTEESAMRTQDKLDAIMARLCTAFPNPSLSTKAGAGRLSLAFTVTSSPRSARRSIRRS